MNYRPPRFLFRRHEIMRSLRRGANVMEIGAANLALTADLLNYFDRAVAVDFTEDLEQSRTALDEDKRARIQTLQANVMRDELPRGFDGVVACEVMEHIEDDRAFLLKLREVLNPGGQVIISVPAKSSRWNLHDELVGHLRRYEKADLVELAEKCGFADIDVKSYGYPWINWLSHLRVWLASLSMMERSDWDQEKQTKMSNHRQIPAWLSQSIVPLLVNRVTIYPFALVSRLFNRLDRSDGYILAMNRPAAVHEARSGQADS